MRHTSCITALATLLLCGTAMAQNAAPPQASRPDTGFFRPAADPALTTVPAPRPEPAQAATPDMSDEVRLAEEARLSRIEASMDRVEQAHARATAKPAPLPPIASPLDGTAAVMSPLDGTAPIVTPTNR